MDQRASRLTTEVLGNKGLEPMRTQSRLRVGIMGAGRMAQGFDDPNSKDVLTLAHAITTCQELELGGFFDLHASRAEVAEARWECPPSPRDRAVWLEQSWDVVCIATPNDQHESDLRDVLAHRPKAILVEKPVATNQAAASHLLREAQDLSVPVLVDFPRRWHSAIVSVRDCISSGLLGKPVAAVFTYVGAPSNSAIHMLDLFHTLWGGQWTLRREGGGMNCSILELCRQDHRVSAAFIGLPASHHYVWEMEIHCEHGKLEFSRSPEVLEIFLTGPHPKYPAFSVLSPRQRYDMEAEPLLQRLMEHIVRVSRDKNLAKQQIHHEIESLAFSSSVLAFLSIP